jgi:hypothetical protein
MPGDGMNSEVLNRVSRQTTDAVGCTISHEWRSRREVHKDIDNAGRHTGARSFSERSCSSGGKG